MQNLPVELTSKLYNFHQRKLTDGEMILLAKVLSEKIDLPGSDIETIATYVISQKTKINKVYDVLCSYIFIDEEAENTILRHTTSFLAWRSSVAKGESRIIFTGDVNNLVDDMSGMLRYVNCGCIATVGDKINDANHLYGLFKDVVTHAFRSF